MEQRGKAVLQGNDFLKINQELTVSNLGVLRVLTRDAITVEQSKVDLADKTQVPGGRNAAGEFNITLQLADDPMRAKFLEWYEQSIDQGRGISPNYKKDGLIRYKRLYRSNPAADMMNVGTAGEPFEIKLIGLWVRSLEFPDYDLSGGDEGDASSVLTCVMCFDDAWARGR